MPVGLREDPIAKGLAWPRGSAPINRMFTLGIVGGPVVDATAGKYLNLPSSVLSLRD
jgi:hypothetical protein